jgi:hypothetical protein
MTTVLEGAVVDRETENEAARTALALVGGRPIEALAMRPIMDVTTAKARLAEFQEFVQGYLVFSKDGGADGNDYGVIPGAGTKRVLFKSGADKLCEVYGMYDEYQVVNKVEDWDRGLFDYELKCILRSRRDDSILGTGLGSCSTFESKYRWRLGSRVCPSCRGEFIIKGREDFGGGWLCFAKKGGCGAKFKDGDPAIVDQRVGRVENPDIIDAKNTALKMAKKRAKIDAVISVTRSAGLFTQDMEDKIADDELVVESVGAGQTAGAQASQEQRQAPQQERPAAPSNNGNGNGGGAERKISEAQAKRLFAIAREAGVQGEDYKRFLKERGYSDDREILRREYEEICKALQER